MFTMIVVVMAMMMVINTMIKETMETMTMITVGGDEEDADEKNNSVI